jgi:Trypsin
VDKINQEKQAWLERVASVTFGIYAWLPEEQRRIEHAGSGVLIAPRLALTAKHVTDDMLRLDSRIDPLRLKKGIFELQYSTMLYHLPRRAYEIRWAVNANWPSADTDITLLQIIPETEGADLLEKICEPAYFDWQLLPPPSGAEVKLYGFPKAEIASDGKDHVGQIPFVEQDGVVEEICEPIRTHRMLEFPCYRISKPVDHGFSGGPVFYEGKLAGIVSAGSSYDPHTWIASLWPLALLTYGLTGFRNAVSRTCWIHESYLARIGRIFVTV